MRQPDFQKIFFDYFGKIPRKVSYSVRQDSNRDHDLIFLGSLIHDARFMVPKVTFRRNRLLIPMNRDCWELGIDKEDGTLGLYTTESRLTIYPVCSVEWSFTHGLQMERQELGITNLWLLQPTNSENRALIIDGFDWSCKVTFPELNLHVTLKDTEIPSFHK